MVIIVFCLFLIILGLAGTLIQVKKNGKLEDVLKRRRAEFQFLNYFSKDALLSNEKPVSKFKVYMDNLKTDLGWTYHAIFALDEERQVLVIKSTGGFPDWFMEELRTKFLVKVGDTAAGIAVSTKQPIVINKAIEDPRSKSIKQYAENLGFKSMSCYPIIGKLKTYGGFCTYSNLENIFTIHHTEYFMVLSNLLGAFLENKLLEEYLTSRLKRV